MDKTADSFESWQLLSHIPQFEMIHPALMTSGQPNAEQLLMIKENGFSTIINVALNDAEPHLAHEDRICLELGVEYLHLPLLWDNPNSETGLLILELLFHRLQQQSVWLHCAKNMRVSCLMYLYRLHYMGIDMATAQNALLRHWQPNDIWQGFMYAVGLQLQARQSTYEIEQMQIPQ